MMSRFILLATSCILILSSKLIAQVNDDCTGAIQLLDVTNFCSGPASYTNVGSTASAYANATCWIGGPTEDVWFSFTAIGTDVLVSTTGVGGGGTMNRPRLAIYSGTCGGTISELGCNNGSNGSGSTQLYEGGLTAGTTYLIRVSTTNANEGTFEICINNYTPASQPSADCNGASYICSNNPISIASLSGPGVFPYQSEPELSSCLGGTESNSAWFVWKAGVSGPFAFDIVPTDPTDDIDFMVYELPGIDACDPTRTLLRCNASAFQNPNGGTGLSFSDSDISEDPGINTGDNAYCSAINVVAGKSYALFINNASAVNGFNLSFNAGNTGSIEGPNPVLDADQTTICKGGNVVFNASASTNCGGGLDWNFVNGGSPTAANGQGPHTVTYANNGNFTAILTGTDNNGCKKTESVIINVSEPPTVDAGSSVAAICQGAQSAPLSGSFGGGATGATWSGGAGVFTSASNASAATYTAGSSESGVITLTLTSVGGCTTVTDSKTIQVNQNPTVSSGAALAAICQGENTAAMNGGFGGGATGATWSGGSGTWTSPSNAATAVYNPAANETGTITLTITSTGGSCGTVTATKSQVINPTPIAPDVSNDTVYCLDDVILPLVVIGNGGTYTWYGNAGLTNILGNGTTYTPTVALGSPTFYVTETNGFNCESVASNVIVTFKECPKTVVPPSAFTPDGDGVNDSWEINNLKTVYPDHIVYVYDRWGGLVYQTKNKGDYENDVWKGQFNGKDLPIASYYYIIDTKGDGSEKLNGIVTIVRK
jgi:gliding motility-associated-like protein